MPSLRLWFFSIFNTHQGPSHITFSSTAAEQGSSSRKSLNELRSTQCMRIQEVSSSVFLISLFGLSALLWLELLTARGLGDLDILKNHVVTALQIPLPLWRNSRTKLFQSAWASPIETAFFQRFDSSYSYHIYSLTLPYSKNARHEFWCVDAKDPWSLRTINLDHIHTTHAILMDISLRPLQLPLLHQQNMHSKIRQHDKASSKDCQTYDIRPKSLRIETESTQDRAARHSNIQPILLVD